MEKTYDIKKSLIIWGSLGFILRLVFMPMTSHGDLLYIHSVPSLLVTNNVWDVFGYLKDTFVSRGFASYYPPLSYFITALFQFLFKFVNIGYLDWLAKVFNSMYAGRLGAESNILLSAQNIHIYLTLMKTPYLLFDAGCAFILYKYFKDRKESLRAFKLWSVNPVVIFSSYIFGQYGLISAFVLLFSIYLVNKKHYDAAFFLIGCGIMIEMFPFMFLPAMLLIPDATLKKRLRWLFMSAIPVLVVFLPLYITSNGYVKYAFVSYTIKKVMFSDGITRRPMINMIAKTACIISFMILYIKLLINAFNKKGLRVSKISIAWISYSSILLLLFLATGYSPVHYLQWIIPLLIILVVKKIIPLNLFIIQMILLFLFNLDSRSLNMGLFQPINPEYFAQLPSLHEIMDRYFYWGYVISTARFLYSGVCLLIIYKILKNNEISYV